MITWRARAYKPCEAASSAVYLTNQAKSGTRRSPVLGPRHPCGDVATLLVGELFSNSLRHSGSGVPGQTVTVAVRMENDVIRVEVTDRSGPGVPEPRPAGSDAEDGRGLHLVARLAARWGWRRRGGRTVTWFEIQALLRPMQHSARLRSSAAGQGWSPTRAIARVSGTPSISRLVIVAARAPRVPFDRSLSAMANTTP